MKMTSMFAIQFAQNILSDNSPEAMHNELGSHRFRLSARLHSIRSGDEPAVCFTRPARIWLEESGGHQCLAQRQQAGGAAHVAGRRRQRLLRGMVSAAIRRARTGRVGGGNRGFSRASVSAVLAL